jgi:uncharacterized protein (TIGR02449 family)
MDDLIGKLENRIKSLIQQCEYLKHSNLSLKQIKFLLCRQKEVLEAKNQVAISQIESMVIRLKSIEKSL